MIIRILFILLYLFIVLAYTIDIYPGLHVISPKPLQPKYVIQMAGSVAYLAL